MHLRAPQSRDANGRLFVKSITPAEIAEVCRLYWDEKLPGREIAERFGWTDNKMVYHRLKLAGREPRRQGGYNSKHYRKVSREAFLTAYQQGWSIREMARRLNVTHPAIRSRLRQFKLPANPALRGTGEQHFLELLDEYLPKQFRPQFVVGDYTIDFGAPPIAVELVYAGPIGRPSPHASLSNGQRIYSLFKAGFHIIEIVWRELKTLNQGTINEMIAWIESTKSFPTSIREYRVIRSTGEDLAILQCDVNKLPTI